MDSNHQPVTYRATALPIELRQQFSSHSGAWGGTRTPAAREGRQIYSLMQLPLCDPRAEVELGPGIEPGTSFLPRMRSSS